MTRTRKPASLKLVVASAWLVLAVAAMTVGSCSINHKSDEFTFCERNTDCSTGQTCIQGVCTSSDGGVVLVDAKPPLDAFECPTQCTSCRPEAMECKIDCAVSPATCNSHIVCPAGWNCDIQCTTGGSCRNGVDCTDAKSCGIVCKGSNSCRGVQCGEGKCGITCSGTSSCRDVACGSSCACDVECQDPSLCDNVVCSSPACNTFAGGCSSQFPTCNTCQ